MGLSLTAPGVPIVSSVPAHIGDYLPERLLGRGGMAAVYLCRAPSGEAVALKWLDQDHPPLVRRFERECTALARIRHPGVVGWRDHGAWLGRPYLVMEYVEGSDLRVLAPKLHERPPAERYARCRAIGVALADALDALHEAQLVHRDVKPSNVMVAEDGRVVLTDLGVVKDLSDPEGDRTAVGTLVGTLAYAAPEQVDGLRVDARADQFSLGATLYFLLTLRRPFDDRGREQLAPPSHVDPAVPEELEAVVLRLMAPQPADRYPSMREVRFALGADREEGIRIAGRNDAVLAIARALTLAGEGARVLVRPQGTKGSGRGWTAELLSQNARRRGIRVLRPHGEADRGEALAALAGPAPVVVLSQQPLPLPAGAVQVDVPLPPLGVADLRRTVVGVAPRTEEPARVAERLHRLTGGLPSLLVPLLGRVIHGGAICLPESPALPPSALDHLDDLELDDQDVLAALALAGGPVSSAVLTTALPVDVSAALDRLHQRGLAREADGLWTLSAALFSEVAAERAVDPDGLRRRIDEARQTERAALLPLPDRLAAAWSALLAGQLPEAVGQLQRAAAHAQAAGDRAAECEVLCALGHALLELGRPQDARHPLADATALSRVADSPRLRRLSHALRAAAGLREQPRDRGAAAAAIDRLLPILAGAEARPPELADALGMALWAHAAGVISDRANARLATRRAEDIAARLPPDESLQVRLCLLRGARARGDRAAARTWLDHLPADPGTPPLRRLQRAVLAAAVDGQAPPSPAGLDLGLSEAERAALLLP